MKHFFLLPLLALFLSAIKVNAHQIDYESRHDVSVSVGVVTNTRLISGFSEITQIVTSATITAIVSGGNAVANYSYKKSKWTLPCSVEYYYRVNRFLSVGAIGAFNTMKRDIYLNVRYTDEREPSSTSEYDGKARKYNLSILPAVRFDWLRRSHVGLYSKAAVGVSFMMERQKEKDGTRLKKGMDVMPNFQVSLFGVEAGSQRFRVFSEFGVGEQGMAVLGLRYKF